MPRNGQLLRHRLWYARLLRLYPKPFRERFQESMEQTFHDACRANASSGRGSFGLVLWLFVDTAGGIMSEHIRLLWVRHKSIARAALVTLGFMLIPLWGNFYVDGWNWNWRAFLVVGAFVFSAALAFELAVKGMSNNSYRFAMGLAVAALGSQLDELRPRRRREPCQLHVSRRGRRWPRGCRHRAVAGARNGVRNGRHDDCPDSRPVHRASVLEDPCRPRGGSPRHWSERCVRRALRDIGVFISPRGTQF